MKLTTDLKPVNLPLPGDVDVADLPYYPLFDVRLRKSRAWLRAKNWRDVDHDISGPGLAFVLMNLWCRAFREVPAGSIEDDDDVLADAAGVDISYWRAIRKTVLDGWISAAGRLWHPLVAAISWAVWRERLEARFTNAKRAWRAQCKRRADAGLPPEDQPPEVFADWVAQSYPLTAVYISSAAGPDAPEGGPARPFRLVQNDLSEGRDTHKAGCDGHTAVCNAHKSGCNGYTSPKRRIREESIPPVAPQRGAGLESVDKHAAQPLARKSRGGEEWFRNEYSRLCRDLAPYTVKLQMIVQQPGVSSRYSFVNVFKGAWRDGDALVLPSVSRRDRVRADYGADLQAYIPGLKIRNQSVAEARERRAAAAGQPWSILSREVRVVAGKRIKTGV